MEDQCPTEYSVMHDAQWETTRDLSVNYLRENDRDQDYLNRDNALDVIHIYSEYHTVNLSTQVVGSKKEGPQNCKFIPRPANRIMRRVHVYIFHFVNRMLYWLK